MVEQHEPSFLSNDVHQDPNSVSSVLYDLARKSQTHQRVYDGMWERLLESEDEARVWQATDWSGKLSEDGVRSRASPSDSEFKQILNEGDVNYNVNLPPNNVYVPVLDDPITPCEVSKQISRLHSTVTKRVAPTECCLVC
ncbi:hypothetical protein E2C01_085500 [Portunus trituberculatus]|uniref:Uncharacterized protein n=1 Tax=Portunus trituberculatus TaxID=210409 RepID=A0A5B7J160_PORTR|nr:hypothetical protein [Portunus trituberculatus]